MSARGLVAATSVLLALGLALVCALKAVLVLAEGQPPWMVRDWSVAAAVFLLAAHAGRGGPS